MPGVFRMSDLGAPILNQKLDPVAIPQAEMTPLMRKVMAGADLSVESPGMQVVTEEEEFQDPESQPREDNEEARMQELRDLGGKINDLIIKIGRGL